MKFSAICPTLEEFQSSLAKLSTIKEDVFIFNEESEIPVYANGVPASNNHQPCIDVRDIQNKRIGMWNDIHGGWLNTEVIENTEYSAAMSKHPALQVLEEILNLQRSGSPNGKYMVFISPQLIEKGIEACKI